jgi:predicted small lipoprotein YifL
MKKLIALFLVVVMVLSFAACGKKDTPKDEASQTQATEGSKDTTKADESVADIGVTVIHKDGKTIFTVDQRLGIKQDAWVGFCPGTEGYVNEADADANQVAYAYTGYDEGNDTYNFEFDDDTISGLGDGDYVVVVCDSDAEGKVILYIPAVIQGSKVTCDFSKAVIN